MGLVLLFFSLILTHVVTSLYLLLLKFLLPNTTPIDLSYAANWLVSLSQALLTTLVGTLFSYQSQSNMMDVKLPWLVPYAWLALGYWLYDLVSLSLMATKATNKTVVGVGFVRTLCQHVVTVIRWWPGMVAHHVGVITFLWVAIIGSGRQRGDGMIAVSLLMELSSVFVAARSCLARLGLKDSKFYLVVSIFMVVSFFAVRVVLIPAVVVLYSWQEGMTLSQGLASMPSQCVIGTIMFYSLNCYWFYLMARGCVKVMSRPSKKE